MKQTNNIFDNGHCLTEHQLSAYVTGQMSHEEGHAVEQHLSGCPLCSDAVDGMWWAADQGLPTTAPSMPAGLLLPNPPTNSSKLKTKNVPFHPTKKVNSGKYAAAAALVLVLIGLGYGAFYFTGDTSKPIAQANKDVEYPGLSSSDSFITTYPDAPSSSHEAETETPSKETTAQTSNPQTGAHIKGVENIKSALPATEAETHHHQEPLDELAYNEDAGKNNVVQGIENTETATDKKLHKNIYPAPVNNANNAPKTYSAKEKETSYQDLKDTETAAKTSSTSQDDLLQKAKGYYALGNYDAAINSFQQLINQGGAAKDEATYYMAICYQRQGHHEKATALLQSLADGNSSYARKAKRALKQ